MSIVSARDKLVEKIEEVANTATDLEKLSYAGASLEKLANMEVEPTLADDIYSIGTPGTMGFGVAAIPDEYLPDGFIKLSGHTDSASANYGCVMDGVGSVFCYIPAFYYKMTGNIISISKNAETGYVLPRAFIDSPKGFLHFKFLAGNEGGKLVSKQFLDPLSTNSSHNPIGSLISAPANTYGGFVDACSSAGYKCTTIFEWTALALLALAQGQSGASSALCAFNDVSPYFPKGCNNNALADVNDTSLTFIGSGYSNCALTGSGSTFAKTTHNGQDCGVADMNGNMYKIVTGLTYLAKVTSSDKTTADDTITVPSHSLAVGDTIYFGFSPSVGSSYNTASYTVASVADADTIQLDRTLDADLTSGSGVYSAKYFRILKTSVNPNTLTSANLTDESLYDLLDLTGIVDNNSGNIYFGNGVETVLNFSTDTNSNTYKKANVGIPTQNGVSSSGTSSFGNDRLYRYLRHGLVPRVEADWGGASGAGVFQLHLYYYVSYSHTTVGGFASKSL